MGILYGTHARTYVWQTLPKVLGDKSLDFVLRRLSLLATQALRYSAWASAGWRALFQVWQVRKFARFTWVTATKNPSRSTYSWSSAARRATSCSSLALAARLCEPTWKRTWDVWVLGQISFQFLTSESCVKASLFSVKEEPTPLKEPSGVFYLEPRSGNILATFCFEVFTLERNSGPSFGKFRRGLEFVVAAGVGRVEGRRHARWEVSKCQGMRVMCIQQKYMLKQTFEILTPTGVFSAVQKGYVQHYT